MVIDELSRYPEVAVVKGTGADQNIEAFDVIFAKHFAKIKQIEAKDNKRYVKPHNIKVNEQVLLKQRCTKIKPPGDPEPYTVTSITGHQMTAIRGH